MPEKWVDFIWKFAIIVDSIAEHVHINLLEVRLKLMYWGEVIDGKQMCWSSESDFKGVCKNPR